MTDANPKLFVSYSWTSTEHQKWVLNLAAELRDNGVDVIMDKWDLREGDDAHAFMERMVTDLSIQKVIMVCDGIYTEKADDRTGGVGTESQILSAEIYTKREQSKFVAVVTERDDQGKPFLPTYYKSRVYIDLSDPDSYATGFEQLLRWIYDKPLHIKPDLGKKPAFLNDTRVVTLGTSSQAKRALDSIRNSKDYRRGAIAEYIDAFTANLERFRLTDSGGDFDDRVVESIEQFIPYRNEAVEIMFSLAQYGNASEASEQVHRFFEGLLSYMFKPEHISRYHEWDFDNFRFIIHELFLYTIAGYLKYEQFDTVGQLLRRQFYFERNGQHRTDSFTIIRQYMKSLEHRNERLKLRRLSLRADFLMQRTKGSGISERQLMQSDFVLYMRDCLDVLRSDTSQTWWPETLVYAERHEDAFEIFARGQSKTYFDKLKQLFDIENKADMEPLVEAFANGALRVPTWQFNSFTPVSLMGFKQLATRP